MNFIDPDFDFDLWVLQHCAVPEARRYGYRLCGEACSLRQAQGRPVRRENQNNLRPDPDADFGPGGLGLGLRVRGEA